MLVEAGRSRVLVEFSLHVEIEVDIQEPSEGERGTQGR